MILATGRRQGRRAPAAPLLAVPLVAALLLTGCGRAEDLAQDARDAAGQKASAAAEAAESKAASKAADMAAEAARKQVCALVEDGSLSASDARKLKALIPTAQAAGLPDDLVALARAVAKDGSSASKKKVAELAASACAG